MIATPWFVVVVVEKDLSGNACSDGFLSRSVERTIGALPGNRAMQRRIEARSSAGYAALQVTCRRGWVRCERRSRYTRRSAVRAAPETMHDGSNRFDTSGPLLAVANRNKEHFFPVGQRRSDPGTTKETSVTLRIVFL
jgi:hypothetical protein